MGSQQSCIEKQGVCSVATHTAQSMLAQIFSLVLGISATLAVETEYTYDIPKDTCGVRAIINEERKVELFSLSLEKTLLHKRQISCGNWTSWNDLGGSFASGPHVVKNSRGQLEIYVRGTDKAIYRKVSKDKCGEEWSKWQCLGGKFSTPPEAILNSEGYIHVFARGIDRAVWHLAQLKQSSGNVTWSDWTSMGGIVTSSPATMLDSEGLLHVFARGITRGLVVKSQVFNGTELFWSSWQSLGGLLASGPKMPVVSSAVNLLEVYVPGADKALWRKHQKVNASTTPHVHWSHWETLGGVFSSGPASVVNLDGLVDVFGRGTDKSIWHKKQTYRDGGAEVAWKPWEALGGMLSTAPAVVKEEESLLHVFARGIDKGIWHKMQVEGVNGTVTWSRWQSLGGLTRKFT